MLPREPLGAGNKKRQKNNNLKKGNEKQIPNQKIIIAPSKYLLS